MQNEEHKKPATANFFMRIGVGVIVSVFGGLIIWSVVAPIQSAVTAPGQIVVEGNRKSVQHLDGGTVVDILVRDGARVDQGDVIVRLDDTVPRANLSVVNSQLGDLYARRARLESERDSTPVIKAATGIEDVLKMSVFQQKYQSEKNLFEARATTTATQIELLKERVTQQEERIAGLVVQIRSLDRQISLINDELKGVRELFAEGVATKTRLLELERQSESLIGERGARRASVAESQSIISEAKLEVERLMETRREEAIAELREVAGAIGEGEERRIAAEDEFQRTQIKAPSSGRVLGLSVHTVGGVIAPREPLMEIVPADNALQVSARISPQDVDKIQIGQATLVRFSGFGSRSTPETDGMVKDISADSLVDELTGAAYYQVVIELPVGEELSDILRGNILVPGMPVETFIRTGKRPAISYLIKPLVDSFARSLREE